MRRFEPIALPKIYRRSFIAREAGMRASTFAVLLAQLAPERYRALHYYDPLSVYQALLDHVGTLFPIWEPEWFPEEFDDLSDMVFSMEASGIPVSAIGVEGWDLEYGSSATLGIVSYLLEQPAQRVAVEKLHAGIGKPWRKLWTLEPFWDKQIAPKMIDPPKGRQWRGRWDQMPMVVKYVEHDTRYQWLDISRDEADEGYNPPWTMDDIRFLERDWAQTAPVWKALRQFIEWLDKTPGSRLPWMLWALTGDEKVRMKLSEPKQEKKVKTLAEVFMKDEG